MARQADAHDLQADPAPDFHGQDRERDRDAQPPFEHVVQTAVAGIVVVVGVAAESLLAEQELAESVEGGPAAAGLRHAGASRQVVQRRQRGFDRELGVLDARDRQRRAAEIDFGRSQEVPKIAQRPLAFGCGSHCH